MLLKLFDQSINLPDAWMSSPIDNPCCVGVGGTLWFSSTRRLTVICIRLLMCQLNVNNVSVNDMA